MSTRTRKAKRKGASGAPVFITKSQLAHAMGDVDCSTIDDWVAAGTFPPPHDTPGARTAIWKRAYFDAYVDTGSWPPEAFRPPGS